MKKIVILLMVMFFATGLFAGDMFSYIPYKSVTWDQKVTTDSGNGKEVTMQKVWYKNKKMRTELKTLNPSTGKKEKQIVIIGKKYIHVINPVTNEAFRYSLSKKNSPMAKQMDISKYRKKAKKTGSGKASGVSCNIYKYAIEIDMGSGKMKSNISEWRSKKGKFVMKSVSKSEPYKMMGYTIPGSKTITEISNLKKKAAIKDSIFKISKKIKIRDMDKMMDKNKAMMKKQSKKRKSKAPEKSTEEMSGEAAGEAVQDMMKGLFGE